MTKDYWWKSPDGKTRPDVKKIIIILTEDRRVVRGYMNASKWPGEEKLTYSFHGEYYDFSNHKLIYCLVNALGWMDFPDVPELKTQFDAIRLKELECERKDKELANEIIK